MAEEKDELGNELMGQDFLGDLQKNVDNMPATGLFDKLAKLGAQQRLQPLADQKRFESGYKPLLKMVEDAEDRVTAGMLAHKLANPDIDDSKLHSGVGDLVTSTMTENNARFKELNRQLAYMSPRNPKYADLTAEIAEINKNSLGLRDQNAKLMEIKNTMNHKDFDIKEMSKGNYGGVKNMYSDIQQGISDNFQTIDGKLYWVDPNPDVAEDDPDKKTSVESIQALAPEMTFGEANVQHNGMLSAVSNMPADSPNYNQNLNVSTMFTDIGDAGVKSLIFDNENSEEDDEGNLVGWSNGGDMFNTSNWFESFYNDLGVTDPNTMIDIRQAIQKNGVTHKITGADGKERRVADHFRKWYINELKKVEKSEKGKPKPTTTLNNFPGEEESGGNDGETTQDSDTTFQDTDEDLTTFNEAWSTKNESKFIDGLNKAFPALDMSKVLNEANMFRNDEVKFDLDNPYFKDFDFSIGGKYQNRAKARQGSRYMVGSSVDKDKFLEVLNIYSNAKSVETPPWYDGDVDWIDVTPSERMKFALDNYIQS